MLSSSSVVHMFRTSSFSIVHRGVTTVLDVRTKGVAHRCFNGAVFVFSFDYDINSCPQWGGPWSQVCVEVHEAAH